ncbi:MAG TPA: hypothetical protein VGN63_18860 [Flavisolibacter sp.]|jgi:hypothetical protein|nr:hypothetical protein [Flavisolibacter sp.]
MWGWGKKRERQIGAERQRDRLFRRVDKRLQRWAGILQQKTLTWSPKKQKAVLALFCFLFISAGTYTIWRALHHNDYLLKIDPIRPFPLQQLTNRRPPLSEAEHARLHQLRRTLDSLAVTKEGRQTLDSILHDYPDLRSTVLELDNLYHQQIKK